MKISKPKKFVLRPNTPEPPAFAPFNRIAGHYINHRLQPIQYEPMRLNRWMVEFEAELNIEPYLAKSVTRPMYSIDNNANGGWDNIVIEFLDVIGSNLSQTLITLINPDIDRTIGFRLAMLDPTGVVVESWNISGNIYSVDWSNLAYDNSEICTISVSITPRLVALT